MCWFCSALHLVRVTRLLSLPGTAIAALYLAVPAASAPNAEGTRSASPAWAKRSNDMVIGPDPHTGTLRAPVQKPLTMRSEIRSDLLDGEAGWRFSSGHGSGWAAAMFVTVSSICNYRGVATIRPISGQKRLRIARYGCAFRNMKSNRLPCRQCRASSSFPRDSCG
jgi:hypothetical protein